MLADAVGEESYAPFVSLRRWISVGLRCAFPGLGSDARIYGSVAV
jgi:hypothetical protein